MLVTYDVFQLQNNVKPDYANVGGLQMWSEAEQEWNNWYIETDTMYYDDELEWLGAEEDNDVFGTK